MFKIFVDVFQWLMRWVLIHTIGEEDLNKSKLLLRRTEGLDVEKEFLEMILES